MYWQKVMKEVLNKNLTDQNFVFTNQGKISGIEPLTKNKPEAEQKKPVIKYNLGDKLKNIQFSQREAEVMILLIKGNTICNAAKMLCLSPRTVESYMKNMKRKIKVKTKSELISLIIDSDFLYNIQQSQR